jgi:hypothetical protein
MGLASCAGVAGHVPAAVNHLACRVGAQPAPISQEELRAAFTPSNGWKVAAIEPDRVQTRYHDDGAPAWLATIKRIQTA